MLITLVTGIIGLMMTTWKLQAKAAPQQAEGNLKGDKDGLADWFKILGQVGLGIIVGATLYANSSVTSGVSVYRNTVRRRYRSYRSGGGWKIRDDSAQGLCAAGKRPLQNISRKTKCHHHDSFLRAMRFNY